MFDFCVRQRDSGFEAFSARRFVPVPPTVLIPKMTFGTVSATDITDSEPRFRRKKPGFREVACAGQETRDTFSSDNN